MLHVRQDGLATSTDMSHAQATFASQAALRSQASHLQQCKLASRYAAPGRRVAWVRCAYTSLSLQTFSQPLETRLHRMVQLHSMQQGCAKQKRVTFSLLSPVHAAPPDRLSDCGSSGHPGTS